MYSTFPLGVNNYAQSKAELSQYSGSEVKEALSQNISTIGKIINGASPEAYITEALMTYMDQIIRKDIILGDKPGDEMAEKLDDLYNSESVVSEKEKALIEEANSYDPADTVPIDMGEALKAHLRVDASKKFITRDEKTKSFEKAMFLGLFNDVTRLQKSQNPNNLILKELTTPSGSSWNYLGDSFVGGHTLAVNSDSYKINNGSNNLLGVIADGVTTSVGTAMDYFGGHNLSKLLTQNIQNFNFQSFETSDLETRSKDNLNSEELEAWTKISESIIDFFSELHAANFKHNPQENFFDEVTEFLEQAGKPNSAKAIQEKGLQNTITAMAPFYGIVKELSTKLKDAYPKLDQPIGLASTLQYAVELGDKIVTVKLGDSDVSCYGVDGKKLDPESKFIQRDTCSEKLEGSYLRPSNYMGINLNKDADLEEISFPPIVVNKDGNVYANNYYLGELSVSIYDKKVVDQVMISSDGCLANGKELDHDMQTDPKQNFISLISNNDSDDKTALVFKKAS